MRRRRSLRSPLVRLRARLAAATLTCVAACHGSIEGTVFGTDGGSPVRVSGHPVFLLSTAAEVASVLKSVCPANGADWSERSRAERSRLEQLAAAYDDSARSEMTLRHGGRRWAALVRATIIYRDSARATDGRPPAVPADLIEKLAMNRVSTGDDGRYAFSKLPPGPYLVVTELRDEFRWVPVQVARAKRVADITPRASQTSCDVAQRL